MVVGGLRNKFDYRAILPTRPMGATSKTLASSGSAFADFNVVVTCSI